MTIPTSLQEALDRVRRSRVLDDARVAAFLEQADADELAALSPAGVLGRMRDLGFLTDYQLTRLAAGRPDGLRVGAYVVLDFLGRGGAGQVFLAEHARLGTRVALKVLSGAADTNPAARGQFVREARAAAAVQHPSIVRVFDVDIDHDPPFLVLEYVDGVSLQAAVAAGGAFSAGEAAGVAAQVALGLQPVADAGLVHRDIKPANVLIDRKGAVKILDLGIARFTSDASSRPHGQTEILGTLDYLAPEQALDYSAVDVRADVYALGATLYFLLAGHPPFPGDDVIQKMARKQSADPPPLHRLRADVPAGLSAVVQRLLARDPSARPSSPSAAADLLAPWVVPAADFPARLFRPNRPSTHADEGKPTDHVVLPEVGAVETLGRTVESVPLVATVGPPDSPCPPVGAPRRSAVAWVVGGLVAAAAAVSLVARWPWRGGN